MRFPAWVRGLAGKAAQTVAPYASFAHATNPLGVLVAVLKLHWDWRARPTRGPLLLPPTPSLRRAAGAGPTGRRLTALSTIRCSIAAPAILLLRPVGPASPRAGLARPFWGGRRASLPLARGLRHLAALRVSTALPLFPFLAGPLLAAPRLSIHCSRRRRAAAAARRIHLGASTGEAL